jgi:hypothetical protein
LQQPSPFCHPEGSAVPRTFPGNVSAARLERPAVFPYEILSATILAWVNNNK